jgi:hypothetical protein
MTSPHRIVIQKQTNTNRWVIRDTIGGEEIRVGDAENIRQAADLAADFVSVHDRMVNTDTKEISTDD